MARFFPYHEIVGRSLTPVEDIQWLAGQIARLPPFVEGAAVLCGSVSWSKHCWRSDIDVVHFSTLTHPHVERSIGEVVRQYLDRTEERFITPRIDVITIGAESVAFVNNDRSVSASALSHQRPMSKEKVSDLFSETAVLFADHIGAIACLRGDPWQAFLNRYLASANKGQPERREAIKCYVERMTSEWMQQPLHQLNSSPDRRFENKQLDLISKTENYPINLMRRILGYLNRYPSPDRASDVRQAFSAIEEPWSRALLVQCEPFFSLDSEYKRIVAACKRSQNPLSSADYYDQVRSLFIDLPFIEMQNICWQFLENEGKCLAPCAELP